MSDTVKCARCVGTGREPSKIHTTKAPCWGCGGTGVSCPAPVDASLTQFEHVATLGRTLDVVESEIVAVPDHEGFVVAVFRVGSKRLCVGMGPNGMAVDVAVEALEPLYGEARIAETAMAQHPGHREQEGTP